MTASIAKQSASPHKAPQFRIMELKNQIREVENNTQRIREQIEQVDVKFKKINNNSKYLNYQT